MAPDKMKAIKIVEGNKAELQEVPVPKLRDDYVLVKVSAVALNPTDWKHIDMIGKPGCTVGVDMCGTIEEIGSAVTRQWKKGDRIANFCHGGNESQPEDGCFAEYCVSKGDLGLNVPETMSDEDAATLGAGIITCGQALYQSLDLPLPGDGFEKYNNYILIYGGSTATGTLAIQFAILSGCKVLATASQHNHPLLKALGAEEVFDYKDPACAQKIREYTHDSLKLALDCIAEGDSTKICEEAISSKQGGSICYLLPTAKHTREDVKSIKTLGYTVNGEAFDKFGKHFEARPDDFEFCKKFWAIAQQLVNAGQIAPHPAKVGPDGLKGVFEGLQEFRDGKVSGMKLVYRVEETP
ncbi:related to zinc-binding oxidoreductase [Lecanosticta acicola]|uniref:Related to zinc-binding oxidoreductase n=1 Tax=Lecanosticta acicola TaxID=111012 RepID=A0AAI8Z3F3_9PEZI|nr:related to zinc-binding oxidoreductase [Lecanosticta acicola]